MSTQGEQLEFHPTPTTTPGYQRVCDGWAAEVRCDAAKTTFGLEPCNSSMDHGGGSIPQGSGQIPAGVTDAGASLMSLP
jgi:hypothetical protein